MYTAQGEFLCRPNVEKYGDVEYYANPTVDCYGVKVNAATDCDTCGKVKSVLTSANKPFDAKTITQCKTPGGTWRDPMKNNTASCRYPGVRSDGYIEAQCKKDNFQWTDGKTGLDLTTCVSGKLKNADGVLQCLVGN
jgi:hypothetical protein